MSIELVGTLYRVYPTQAVSDRFSKREFVIKNKEGEYDNYVKMQLTNSKVDLIDAYTVGQEIRVSVNIGCRPYVDKNNVEQFYTNVSAWRIQHAAAVSANESSINSDFQMSQVPGEDDDLPF
jgi:pectin methylesterase-like acyl-CoA thioesterase